MAAADLVLAVECLVVVLEALIKGASCLSQVKAVVVVFLMLVDILVGLRVH